MVVIVRIVMLILLITISLIGIGIQIGSRIERSQAIEANVGHYAADPKTGVTKFVYGKAE